MALKIHRPLKSTTRGEPRRGCGLDTEVKRAKTVMGSRKTARPRHAPAVKREATGLAVRKAQKLRAQIGAMQKKLSALLASDVPRVILPELHDEKSGRLEAQKLADFLGVALKPLAEGIGLNYKAVHRNPSAAGYQAALRPVKRTLELLHEFFGPAASIRAWLNVPHPDLDGATALETILAGKADAVALILENARNGVPV